MSNKWVLQRTAVLMGLTMLIHGVIAFFTYMEEDEPCEPDQFQGARPGVGAGWGKVLPLSSGTTFGPGTPPQAEGNGIFLSPWN